MIHMRLCNCRKKNFRLSLLFCFLEWLVCCKLKDNEGEMRRRRRRRLFVYKRREGSDLRIGCSRLFDDTSSLLLCFVEGVVPEGHVPHHHHRFGKLRQQFHCPLLMAASQESGRMGCQNTHAIQLTIAIWIDNRDTSSEPLLNADTFSCCTHSSCGMNKENEKQRDEL